MFERERIDEAVKRREAAIAELYWEDSAKVYGDEEHAEREVATRREFQATMDAIEEDVDQQILGAEEALLVTENVDPTDALATEEFERANAKGSFVADECFTLPLDRLVQRCRAVLAQGERTNMFLYAFYAGQRVGNLGSMAGQYVNRRCDVRGVVSEESGAQEVREIVAELKKRLDPDGEKKREAARKAVEAARELKNYLWLNRQGAKSIADLYKKRKYGGAW